MNVALRESRDLAGAARYSDMQGAKVVAGSNPAWGRVHVPHYVSVGESGLGVTPNMEVQMTIGEVHCLENSRPKGLGGSTPSTSA